jgi:hypothetical protein
MDTYIWKSKPHVNVVMNHALYLIKCFGKPIIKINAEQKNMLCLSGSLDQTSRDVRKMLYPMLNTCLGCRLEVRLCVVTVLADCLLYAQAHPVLMALFDTLNAWTFVMVSLLPEPSRSDKITGRLLSRGMGTVVVTRMLFSDGVVLDVRDVCFIVHSIMMRLIIQWWREMSSNEIWAVRKAYAPPP